MKLLTLFKKKEKSIDWKQIDNMIIARNKICKCIHSSKTIKHLLVCSNLINNFVKLFGGTEGFDYYYRDLITRKYYKSLEI